MAAALDPAIQWADERETCIVATIMATATHPPRLVAIGLDGADSTFIEQRYQQLPTLARLFERGRVYRPTPPHALSGSVWATFYNGVPPGEHGIYQHLVWDPSRMRIRRLDPSYCYHRPFWGALEREGSRVAVIDVPYYVPGSLRTGFEVSDWGTHAQTWPMRVTDRNIEAWVRRRGPHPIGRETPIEKTPRQLDAIRRTLCQSPPLKVELLEYVLDTVRPDVLLTVFGEVHRAGHTLFVDADANPPRPGESTPLLEVYRAMDSALGRLLARIDVDTTDVLVFSIHGMGRDYAQHHLARPLVQRINAEFLRRQGRSTRQQSGVIQRLRQLVPSRIQYAVGAAAPEFVRSFVVEREIIGGLDWSRTPGFTLRTDIRTEIRLNLRGREAKGVLEPNSRECDDYVQLVRESFDALVDLDTGERLVAEIVDVATVHPGPRSDRLPDLVIEWRPCPLAQHVAAGAIGELVVPCHKPRRGDHVDRGFAVLTGPSASRPDLPPLDATQHFAGFIRSLVRREGLSLASERRETVLA